MVKQAEVLKHHADPLEPEVTPLRFIQRAEILLPDLNRSPLRPVDAGQAIQQGGFAAATGPDDREHLSSADAEAGQAQREAAARIAELQILGLDGGGPRRECDCAHRRPSSSRVSPVIVQRS